MALSVDVFIRDDQGSPKILGTLSPAETLAGSESYRQLLYGSDHALSLGLKLLPALRTSFGIFAETDRDLAQLEREVNALLKSLAWIVSEDRAGRLDRPQRPLQNIIRAVSKARRVGGGVVIWSPVDGRFLWPEARR